MSNARSGIYLDANATTAISSAARDALMEVIVAGPHNPSSAHEAGARARTLLERARQEVADALGEADSDNVFFTSGGTESNNIVIRWFADLSASIYCAPVEHPSVLLPVKAASGTVVPVRGDGLIDVDAATQAVRAAVQDAPVLFCIQAANSETGIVQPLRPIVEAVKSVREDAYVLVDAAQAMGRIRLDVDLADAVTFSGHKLHAPAGTGVLYLSDRLLERLPHVFKGGGQEGGVRPGTQNVAGACALAVALEERMSNFEEHTAKLASLRDRLQAGILAAVPGSRVVGADVPRVPNTLNVCFPGTDAQALLARLDGEGVYCSTGSACSSARPEASPVLKAMGMSEREASSCLRFSVSVDNTQEEMDAAAQIVGKCVSEGLRIGL